MTVFHLFNENRSSDLTSLIKLGIKLSDIRKLFLFELTVLMAVSTIISAIISDIVMKYVVSLFYSHSDVFVRIVFHKDLQTYIDIISSAVLIVILSLVFIMKDKKKERTEYVYHFRSDADNDVSYRTFFSRIFCLRDMRYYIPTVIFSAFTVFISVSVVCMSGLMYTDYDGADIIVSANPDSAYYNTQNTESIFVELNESIENCEIISDMSYTGFTCVPDSFSHYSTFEIINNKQTILVRLVPIESDTAPEFMSALVSSEYDISLFSSTIRLNRIAESTSDNGTALAISGVYSDADDNQTFTLYISKDTFEALCGFYPITVSESFKFESESDYLFAKEIIESTITDEFRFTDARQNFSEQNSNSKAIEMLVLYMSSLFTIGACVVIFAFSLSEKNANRDSDRIIIRLGLSLNKLRKQHIVSGALRYLHGFILGFIPSVIVIVLSIIYSNSAVSVSSIFYLLCILSLLFISISGAYFKMKARDE